MKWNKQMKLVICFSVILAFAGLYWALIRATKNTIVQGSVDKRQVPSLKQPYNLADKRLRQIHNGSPVNVCDISKVDVIEASLCTKTRTPSVFIICIYNTKKDIYVSGQILSEGQWEPKITQMIYDVLNQGRNITFIDIGANMGYFSLFAASIGQPVIAVEPWDQHIAKFAMSIRLNKFEDKITVIKNAVSNTRHVVRIDVSSPDNQGAARVISEEESVLKSVIKSFNATTIVFNDLVDLISTKDVAIKLDIEGHECRALEKANEIFERFNVVFISMELQIMQNFRQKTGAACPVERILWMIDMLTSHGFIPYSYYGNRQLDPKKDEMWTLSDIFWKRKIK